MANAAASAATVDVRPNPAVQQATSLGPNDITMNVQVATPVN